MNQIYENIILYCKERGTNYKRMCDETGISYGVISNLKKYENRKLRSDTAIKVASYLGISVNTLLGEKEEQPTTHDDELSDIEKELIRCWRMATQDEKENVSHILRHHGMPFPEVGSSASNISIA